MKDLFEGWVCSGGWAGGYRLYRTRRLFWLPEKSAGDTEGVLIILSVTEVRSPGGVEEVM